MKAASVFAIGWISFCGMVPFTFAEDAHTMITPTDVKWGPAPKVLPAGAQAAVLFGDPTKEGLFALRVKFPAGYAIAPHTHPVDEVVTVISGTFNLGMGGTAEKSTFTALPAGSFFASARDAALCFHRGGDSRPNHHQWSVGFEVCQSSGRSEQDAIAEGKA